MTSAYVFIKLSSGVTVEILSAIREIDGVTQAHIVLGPVDAIAFVEVKDMEALGVTVMALQAMEGIASTDTRLAWPV